jgi:hypothetical protein
MAETSETLIFQHSGVFTIGTRMPGAPLLQAILTVGANSSMVTGHGTLTQTTNPPLHANNSFQGVVHALGLGPAKQVYALHGQAIPPLFGAPHVSQLIIVLDGIWGTQGKATYAYVTGAVMHEVRDVPVAVRWLLQES